MRACFENSPTGIFSKNALGYFTALSSLAQWSDEDQRPREWCLVKAENIDL